MANGDKPVTWTVATAFIGLILAVLLLAWNHIGSTYATEDRVDGIDSRLERIENQLDKQGDKLDRIFEKVK